MLPFQAVYLYLPLIPLAAAVCYVIYAFSQGIKNPLASIPGPWYSRWSGLVLRYHFAKGNRFRYVHRLHTKYGPIVRISPDEVDVSDSPTARHIHRIGGGYLKSPFYRKFALEKNSEHIFNTIDPDFHKRHRKLLSSAMSERSLDAVEPQVVAKVRLTIQRMGEEAKVRGAADVWKWWLFMTTDVIGELSFGDSFRMLEQGKTNQYFEDLKNLTLILGIRTQLPYLIGTLRVLRLPVMSNFGHIEDRIIDYAEQSISRYRNMVEADPTSAKQTFFTKFYAHGAGAGDEKLSHKEIVGTAQAYIVAGSDTTSNTLTFLVWAVCRRPDVKRKLLAELAAAAPADGALADRDLKPLPYLGQVIEETLRLYSAVPSALPRAVPRGGDTLAGHYVPEGYTVCTQAYSMHRDPVVFPDCERFIPERWANPTKEMKDAFMPFGAGSRNCIGLHLARMELRLATAHFFRTYPNAKVSDREGMSDRDMDTFAFFLMFSRGKRCLVELS